MAITLIVLNIISFNYSYLIIAVAVVLFTASLLIKELRQARVVPVVTGSVIFACLIFIVVNTSAVQPAKALDNTRAVTYFQLVDIPEYSAQNDSYTYIVKTQKIEKQFAPQEIKLKIKTKEKIDADLYDTVKAELYFYSTSDNAFDSYGDYGDSIYIRARLSDIDGVQANENKPINYYLIKLRVKLFDIMNSEFRGDNAGLSIALLTGNKSYLSYDFQQNLRICGLSHFFAVSGFHISLICLGLYCFLRLLKIPKVLNTILTLLLSFAYCAVADYSSSSIRACIMLAVLLVGRLFNYKSDGLNSLGLAVFIICLNPFAVSDASAFLSVSAMLGILVVYNSVRSSMKSRNKLTQKLESCSLLSVCVLLSLLPSMYIFFKNISIGSCLLNIAVEPLIIIMLAAELIFCMFSNAGFMAFIPVKIINLVSSLLIKLIDFVSTNLSEIYMNISDELFGFALCGIFVFIAVCLFIKKKVPVKGAVIFISVVLVICSALNTYQQCTNAYTYIDKNGMVIIYDRDSAVAVGIGSVYDKRKADKLTDGRNTLYIDCKVYAKDIEMNENYSNRLDENIIVSVSENIINVTVFDKHFKIDDEYVIINSESFYRYTYGSSTDSDNLLLSFAEASQIEIRREYNVSA